MLTLLLAGVARATPPAYDATFDQHWKDGKAELASYDLVVPRYGEDHVGTAVTVIVTEPFNDALRVKSDRGGPGSFGALKLNLVEDFPTGIYDYNVMTSVFVATQPTPTKGLGPGDVTKISYSSQEWCGQAWHQAVFRPTTTPTASVRSATATLNPKPTPTPGSPTPKTALPKTP